VSWIATPSRRNSGFQSRRTVTPCGASSAIAAWTAEAVPIGTVDLPTTSDSDLRYGATERAEA
jgi:hypothetical protein